MNPSTAIIAMRHFRNRFDDTVVHSFGPIQMPNYWYSDDDMSSILNSAMNRTTSVLVSNLSIFARMTSMETSIRGDQIREALSCLISGSRTTGGVTRAEAIITSASHLSHQNQMSQIIPMISGSNTRTRTRLASYSYTRTRTRTRMA